MGGFATFADLAAAKDLEELRFINTGNLAQSMGVGAGYLLNLAAAFNSQTLSLAAAAGTGTQLSTSTTGSWQHRNVSPKTKWIRDLNLHQNAAVNANFILIDMLAYWGSCVVTGTPTTLASVALPRYASGAGVQGLCVVATTLGGATPVLTVNMTDSDNNAVSEILVPGGTGANVLWYEQGTTNRNHFLARNKGIKSIDSYTIGGTGVSGTAHFMLFKPLAFISSLTVSRTEKNLFTGPCSPVQIQDGACLGLIAIPSASTFANTSKVSVDMVCVSA